MQSLVQRSTLAAMLLAATTLVSALPADDEAHTDRIQKLIKHLDDERYAVRQAAHWELIEVGQPAIAQLVKASDAGSAEQRYRAREIIRFIQRRELLGGFQQLMSREDAEIDLDESMYLISRLVDLQVRRQDLDKQLDQMASDVRRRLGDDFDPDTAPPRRVIEALIHTLKVEHKLEGNRTNYDHPDNSSLARVLETRDGLPILLSHLAVSVAQRAKLPFVGIPVPGRYMIKYDGSQAPEGQPRDDIIIDPYGDWVVLSVEEAKQVVRSFDPDQHLKPSTHREVIARMLRNLESDFEYTKQPDKAAQTRQLLILVESQPQPLRDP